MTNRSRKSVNQFDSSSQKIVVERGLVGSYLHWRDPKSSGIVFGVGLALLLSLAYSSVISVVSNICLIILTISMLLRVYNDLCRFLNKEEKIFTLDYKFFENDIFSQEKIHEAVDVVIVHLNAFLVEFRRLFLVEDFLMSSKFALMFWVLRYVGAWFSGLTIAIMVFVSAFTLPKIYENNKTLIDEHLSFVGGKIQDASLRARNTISTLLHRKAERKEK